MCIFLLLLFRRERRSLQMDKYIYICNNKSNNNKKATCAQLAQNKARAATDRCNSQQAEGAQLLQHLRELYWCTSVAT